MKKLIVAVLLLAGMTTFAQENNAKPLVSASEKLDIKQRPSQNLKTLTEELKLSDVQQKQISLLLSEQAAKREANAQERKANAEKKVKLTAEEYKKRSDLRKEERAAYNEKIKSILTDEQFTKWQEINQQKKSNKIAE